MMALPTALVVIDAQEGLLEGETAVPDAVGIIHRIRTVMAAARSAGAFIVHLQNDGDPGTLDEPGMPGWFIHPKVAPEPNELVLHKSRDDGFDGTELADLLARNQVRCIAVVGLLSEMCVSATVRGALARGFHVVLIRDAHATYNLDDIPAAIVARVAEHALGDEVELLDAASVTFVRPATASA
jgi:nicotinamidase-related amidase